MILKKMVNEGFMCNGKESEIFHLSDVVLTLESYNFEVFPTNEQQERVLLDVENAFDTVCRRGALFYLYDVDLRCNLPFFV